MYSIAKNRWLFSCSSVRHIFMFDSVSKYILFFDHFYSFCFQSFVIQVLFIFTRSSEASCNNTKYPFFCFWNRHGLHMEMESCWKFNFVCKIKRIEFGSLYNWSTKLISICNIKRKICEFTPNIDNIIIPMTLLLFHQKSILSKENEKNEME